MQGHSDCVLLGEGCWLVAHLPLNWFDSLKQQKCLHFLPGCFCALRKLHWLMEKSDGQHKIWHNRGNRECAAGKSKFLWYFTTCHETVSLPQRWWQNMARRSRFSQTSLIWLICLFHLGVDKANGIALNFVIFCFTVGIGACLERKAPPFWVAFTLHRHGEVDFFREKPRTNWGKATLCPN